METNGSLLERGDHSWIQLITPTEIESYMDRKDHLYMMMNLCEFKGSFINSRGHSKRDWIIHRSKGSLTERGSFMDPLV